MSGLEKIGVHEEAPAQDFDLYHGHDHRDSSTLCRGLRRTCPRQHTREEGEALIGVDAIEHGVMLLTGVALDHALLMQQPFS